MAVRLVQEVEKPGPAGRPWWVRECLVYGGRREAADARNPMSDERRKFIRDVLTGTLNLVIAAAIGGLALLYWTDAGPAIRAGAAIEPRQGVVGVGVGVWRRDDSRAPRGRLPPRSAVGRPDVRRVVEGDFVPRD